MTSSSFLPGRIWISKFFHLLKWILYEKKYSINSYTKEMKFIFQLEEGVMLLLNKSLPIKLTLSMKEELHFLPLFIQRYLNIEFMSLMLTFISIMTTKLIGFIARESFEEDRNLINCLIPDTSKEFKIVNLRKLGTRFRFPKNEIKIFPP